MGEIKGELIDISNGEIRKDSGLANYIYNIIDKKNEVIIKYSSSFGLGKGLLFLNENGDVIYAYRIVRGGEPRNGLIKMTVSIDKSGRINIKNYSPNMFTGTTAKYNIPKIIENHKRTGQ